METSRSTQRDRIFRFGPFELSERDAELRKNGVRIKLQEQPFRVLAELATNAGRIVTREELQQRLWPADTFVDFDVGLNTAIPKLRQALNDNADSPHYIETLARRGYRFIAPVADFVAPVPPTSNESLPGASVSLSSGSTSAVDNRPSRVYEFGEFRLECGKRLLRRRDGAPVPVTAKAYDTLVYLVEHSGSVLAKEELMQALWL